ncbi:molybdate ABC transporter substrate-binding protein [Glycomyces halotolerans]
MKPRLRAAVSALAAAALTLTACGDAAETAGVIHVFAAASLTETFNRIGDAFEETHPDIDVVFNFAGSSSLAAQIDQGAPADVFASAAPANMDAVVEAGHADDPRTFTRNELVIAVPEHNPEGIESLADLAENGRKVAVCAQEVPCGAAAQAALEAAGVDLTPATYETDVKAALAKLGMGEVDAALVYRTDAEAASGAVDAVEFPESASAINDYQVAVLDEAANPAAARAFADYLESEEARAVLAEAGFQSP